MTNEEAIKTLEANYPDACFEQLREAVDAAIEALKAQDADSDTISRKAAIDAILAVTGNSSVRELYEHVQEHGLSDMWSGGVNAAIDIIIAVPSARPVAKDTNVPINANDCISRQAAIDALIGITRFKTKHELMQRVNASVQDEQGWLGAVAECLDEIEDLPSAQPELPEWAQKVEEYRKSAPSFVRNQLVWALYQTWKEYDGRLVHQRGKENR